MLGEAIEIIRMLFDGEEHSFRGRFFELEDARLYDVPDEPPPILVAASGPKAARLAAEQGDGLFASGAEPELTRAYRDAGGKGPLYAEVPLCYASSEKKAHRTLEEFHRWGALGWAVLPELRGPRAFEEASRSVRVEDLTEEIPAGPDAKRHLAAIRKYASAGFDHLVLVAIGPDQEGFFSFYEKELGPKLEALRKK
jgi:G6PDH family F420-dependent oxidoreductase